MLRIITKSSLRIITSLFHHYNIIITSLLHRYYNIITLLLRSLSLHYYYVLLHYYYINLYYVLLQFFYYIIVTSLLRHCYVTITKRKSCNNDGIITCYANGMPLLRHYYVLLRHYYADLCYYSLLLISVSRTCRCTGQQRRTVETASYQIYQITISTDSKIGIIPSKNARPKFPARKLSTTLQQKYSTAKQSTVEQETYKSYQISISREIRESWMALDARYLNFDFSVTD